MDCSSQTPEAFAGSPPVPADHGLAVRPDVMDAPVAAARAGVGLRLVSGRLSLAEPSEAAPEAWRDALAHLIRWLGIDVETVTSGRGRGLRQVARWAIQGGGSADAPVFAPWQCWSPAVFQNPAMRLALPRARWVASYLFELGAGRTAAPRSIDLMLMSPHPDSCTIDEDCQAAMPRPAVMRDMIHAAKTEHRSKLAIIVPARCRSAMAMQLLAADRALTRDDVTLDILSIEDAIGLLMGGALPWDAIITLPELRSILFAMLAEVSGTAGPWPMLWHDRDLVLLSGEALEEGTRRMPLDATLLIQSLALVSHRAGMGQAAGRLHEAWAHIRASGVMTPGRGSPAPYANEVSESGFIDLVCRNMGQGNRPVPGWKAMVSEPSAGSTRAPAQLSLVASS